MELFQRIDSEVANVLLNLKPGLYSLNIFPLKNTFLQKEWKVQNEIFEKTNFYKNEFLDKFLRKYIDSDSILNNKKGEVICFCWKVETPAKWFNHYNEKFSGDFPLFLIDFFGFNEKEVNDLFKIFNESIDDIYFDDSYAVKSNFELEYNNDFLIGLETEKNIITLDVTSFAKRKEIFDSPKKLDVASEIIISIKDFYSFLLENGYHSNTINNALFTKLGYENHGSYILKNNYSLEDAILSFFNTEKEIIDLSTISYIPTFTLKSTITNFFGNKVIWFNDYTLVNIQNQKMVHLILSLKSKLKDLLKNSVDKFHLFRSILDEELITILKELSIDLNNEIFVKSLIKYFGPELKMNYLCVGKDVWIFNYKNITSNQNKIVAWLKFINKETLLSRCNVMSLKEMYESIKCLYGIESDENFFIDSIKEFTQENKILKINKNNEIEF